MPAILRRTEWVILPSEKRGKDMAESDKGRAFRKAEAEAFGNAGL